jgi:hypothetical protein
MAKKNPLIKRAHQPIEYTPNLVQELLRCSHDPMYFIEKYVKIQHPVKGTIDFVLYPYQKRLIKSFQNNRFNIVLSARQTGKSTTSAAYLLWFATFHEDKTVLIVSNKNDNAMEMISRIRFAYESLPLWLKPGITDDGWNKHNVGFDNGSRIVSQATSESSGRGLSISLLFCDEFAFVQPGIQEEFWASISPTLATGGSCIIASTPNGDSNLFAQLWRGAELEINGFTSTWVKWDEPPGRDEEFKQKEIGKIGELRWRQEYECEFLSSDALLISSIVLNNIVVPVLPEPDFQGIHWFSELQENQTLLIGIDPATGSGSDMSSIEIYDFPSLIQVGEFRSNTTSSVDLYKTLKSVIKNLEKRKIMSYFSVENNGVGEGIIALYQNDENPPESNFISETGKGRLGMTTTGKSKIKACMNLKELVTKGKIKIKSKLLLTELKGFVRKLGSYSAQYGSTDDSISATLIVIRLLEEISTYEDKAFEMLYNLGDEEFIDDNGETSEYDENAQPTGALFGGSQYGYKQTGSFSDPNDPNSFDPFGGT